MIIDFIRKAFSDGGNPSSSRLLTLGHSLVASFVLVFYVLKTKQLPDGGTLGGLGAFTTAHYLVNRATTAFGKQEKSKLADGGPDPAPAPPKE
jgi:hypothetical protein